MTPIIAYENYFPYCDLAKIESFTLSEENCGKFEENNLFKVQQLSLFKLQAFLAASCRTLL